MWTLPNPFVNGSLFFDVSFVSQEIKDVKTRQGGILLCNKEHKKNDLSILLIGTLQLFVQIP